MTPDRLVEFIPLILQQLQPPRVETRPGNPIAQVQWLNQHTAVTPPVAATPMGSLWPQAPQILANQYYLAEAPQIPQIFCADSGPIQFVNRCGHNSQYEKIPALARCQHVEDHLLAGNGEVAFSRTDFALPGPLAFRWQRFYRHSNTEDTGLGIGWRHSLSEQLQIADGEVQFQSAEGRYIHFRQPAIGHSCFNRFEKLLLHRQSLHSYRLSAFGEADRIFRADGTGSALPLMEIRDRCGNALTVDYQQGMPAKLVSSWGRVVEIQYRDGHIEKLVDRHAPAEQQTLCGYQYESDSDGKALLVDSGAGSSRETFTYTAQILSAIDSGHYGKLHFGYDTHRRCHQLSRDQLQLRLSWGSVQRRCTLRSLERHPLQWTFTENGLVTAIRQQDYCVGYLYDLYGNLCQETGADGQRIFYRHDELGRPVRRTHNGNSERYLYDERGFLCAVQRRDEGTWQFAHSEQGLPLAVTDPAGHQWEFLYSERGQLLQLRDPEGGLVKLDWDGQGQLRSVQRGDQQWALAYDHWQRPVAFNLNGDCQRHWHYGADGELHRVRVADSEFELEYDFRGYPCAVGAAGQPLLHWKNGDNGRPEEIAFADGRRWQLRYNQHNQLRAAHCDRGEIEWQYDPYGRLCDCADAEKHHWQWRYSRSGAVTEYRDNDVHWYFHYTDTGLLQQIRNNSGQQCEFHYDSHRRLIGADNGQSSARFQYDCRDLLIAEHADGRDAGSLSLSHLYDARGWLKGSSSDDLDVAYLFAPDGQLYGVDANGSAVLRCELHAHAADWSQGDNRSHREISCGRLTTLALNNELRWQFENSAPSLIPTGNNPLLSSAEITRDRRGNIVREQRPGKKSREYQYQYNGWGLLTSAACGDFKTYFRYDPFGRRTAKISTHRRSTRQRRIDYRYYALGLWGDTVTVNNEAQPPGNYIHHPLTQMLLSRIRAQAVNHYLVDPSGTPLALLGDGGEVLWTGDGTGYPDAWRGRNLLADSETNLYYGLNGYWNPLLNNWLNQAGNIFPDIASPPPLPGAATAPSKPQAKRETEYA